MTSIAGLVSRSTYSEPLSISKLRYKTIRLALWPEKTSKKCSITLRRIRWARSIVYYSSGSDSVSVCYTSGSTILLSEPLPWYLSFQFTSQQAIVSLLSYHIRHLLIPHGRMLHLHPLPTPFSKLLGIIYNLKPYVIANSKYPEISSLRSSSRFLKEELPTSRARASLTISSKLQSPVRSRPHTILELLQNSTACKHPPKFSTI